MWGGPGRGCTARPGPAPGRSGIFLDGTTFFSGDYLIPGEEVILRLPGGSADDYNTHTRPFLDNLAPGLQICPGHGAPFTLTERSGHDH